MGQYHKLVDITARQFISSYPLGSGLKAWEQCTGGVPAALAALLSRRPGNMPADLNDPMLGAWAGHRLVIAGDYAGNRDIPGFRKLAGMNLATVYGRCDSEPVLEDCYARTDHVTKVDRRTGLSRTVAVRTTREQDFAKRMKEFERAKARGTLIEDVGRAMQGVVEEALSWRFIAGGWNTVVPVERRAVRGDGNRAHYQLPRKIEASERDYYFRACGIPKGLSEPDTLPGGRWPWDRAPLNRSTHSLSTREAGQGQERVWVNLDTREMIDPAGLGETATTAGIMMAAAQQSAKPVMVPDLVIAGGEVVEPERDVGNKLGSATAVFCMLLHPENRGGGDVAASEFPLIGRWRMGRLALTAEREDPDSGFPTTAEARKGFANITREVKRALTTMGKRW